LGLCGFEARYPPPQALDGEEVVAILHNESRKCTHLGEEEHQLTPCFRELNVALDETQATEEEPVLMIILHHLQRSATEVREKEQGGEADI
jgi:hypothetical protein